MAQKLIIDKINNGERLEEVNDCSFFSNFNNCYLNIKNGLLEIKEDGKIIFQSSIEPYETDLHTNSFIFSKDRKHFRKVLPSQIATEFLKRINESITITFASLFPNGFAVSYIIEVDMLNITNDDVGLQMPNYAPVFANEIESWIARVKLKKTESFDFAMDLGKVIVYYAITLLIEYQNKGNGRLPMKIVNEIWEKVKDGAGRKFEFAQNEKFISAIDKIYSDKIKETNIIGETQEYCTKFIN